MTEEVSRLSNFGQKVRTKRRKQMMTLKQLAEKTRLSVSYLSEIERGLAQPSISSFKKIAQAMDFSLFNVSENQDSSNGYQGWLGSGEDRYVRPSRYPKGVKVVRAGQRKKIMYPNQPNNLHELLTPDLNRLLEVNYFQCDPGFDSGPDPIVDPPGEKFLFILKGSVEYRIGEEVVRLNKGDSVSYPGDVPVSFRVLSNETLEAIGVITPPNF